MSQPSFFPSRAVRVAALLFIFVSALAIRLYDLTDPPLDFHPTRQLLSAVKTRALYFREKPAGISPEKLEIGIRQAKLKAQVEPEILEQLVAYTYRFTGEQLWVGRVYSSLFWLIGGIFLFFLVRNLLSFDGALLSTAYYLLFPYAILASRSFQPDPLMVMLIIVFWWAFARWMAVTDPSGAVPSQGMLDAILAGVLGGLAILIKLTAAFFVIGAALGLALSRFSWRELSRNSQICVMAILGALPGVIYLIHGIFIEGSLDSQFGGRFVPALLVNPLYYVQWMSKVDVAAGGIFTMLALLGFFLTRDTRYRSFMFGLWGAYLLYSLIFNYHAATHDYYQLPLIPIVAVSLAPLGEWFFARLAVAAAGRVPRAAAYSILVMGLLMGVWSVRNQMKAVDYRPRAAMWSQIGDFIAGKSAVGLIEDYGSPLEYWGWRTIPLWPYTGDTKYARSGGIPVADVFTQHAGKELFLITDFEELVRQPALEEILKKYPVASRGDGYIIYTIRARD